MILISEKELAGTIKFAMKATKELNSSDLHSRSASLEKLGAALGHDVAKSLAAKGNNDAYAALVTFWSEGGLGTLSVIHVDRTTLRLTNCYDCNVSKKSDAKVTCRFKRSLLETILRESLEGDVRLEELECCKTGGSACVFRFRTGYHGRDALQVR